MSQNLDSLNRTLEDFKKEKGLSFAAWGPLKKSLSLDHYKNWIDQGLHGNMGYLKDHLPFKENPLALNQELKSVISIACSYFPTREPLPEKIPARIALYSQNMDYHHWLKIILLDLIEKFQPLSPGEFFLPFVDSGPVLERDWASQMGMGWVGKNTCIIHPKNGSLFFIAEIFTSIEIPAANTFEPLPDFCGKCQKCIEICPTKALVEPRVLDANKCISYLTIENKSAPPIELRSKIGDWFFGCDLCQTVCPWNQKIFKQMNQPTNPSVSTDLLLQMNPEQHQELVQYFKFLFTSSHNEIARGLKGTPMNRAGAKQLKRNALVVIGNRQMQELKSVVETLNWPEEKELIDWTLAQLN